MANPQNPVASILFDITSGQYYSLANLAAGGAGATVAISQTTPGTTNGVVAGGLVAAGVAASGNPVPVGGDSIGSALTANYAAGQRAVFQFDTRGAAIVRLGGLNNAPAYAVTANILYGLGSSTNSLLAVSSGRWNGATFDPPSKSNIIKRVASSAASGNPDFLKATPGDVMQFWGVCGATAIYLQIYNKASAPTIVTDVPVLTYPIPANAFFSETISNGGAPLSVGVAFAFTTDAAGTTAAAAAAITSFALIGA